MWYALFDFEHEKDVNPLKPQTRGKVFYMRHPHLYRIGPEDQCFGVKHFARWVMYALFQAFVVFMFNFYAVCLPGQQNVDGTDMGFWVVGHTVYGTCVLLANMLIAFKYHNHSGWGEVLAFGSALTFFTIFFMQNLLTSFPELYLIFDITYRQPIVWLATLVTLSFIAIIEMIYQRVYHFELCGSSKSSRDNMDYNSYELDGLIDNGPKGPGGTGVEMQLLDNNN
jgi:magnesium-transporting ATPase (P-type)